MVKEKDKKQAIDTGDDGELDKQVADAVESLDAVGISDDDSNKETVKLDSGQDESVEAPVALTIAKKSNRFNRFFSSKKGRVLLIGGIVILIVVVLMAIPHTRYLTLGTVIKKTVHVKVMDASTKKPVSEALVVIGDKSVKTDKKGEALVNAVSVGEYKLTITKGYYQSNTVDYVVPVIGDANSSEVSLQATGRQVTVNVMNKITTATLAGAKVTVSNTSAITDDRGVAAIVLPADKKVLEGTISLDGYDEVTAKIQITDKVDANIVTITPSGQLYYLSKQTGKINVMKANLDGSDASVAVEGTGNESEAETTLLAARDWSYLALSAKRDADSKKTGQLYLIDAKSNNLKLIDEGEASFRLVGWSGHKFVYLVYRNNANVWEPRVQRLKSYDADTGKITILDENEAVGTNYFDHARNDIASPYIIEGKIIYSKVWYRINPYTEYGKKSAIMSVNSDGSQKQQVKAFDEPSMSLDARLYAPQEIYFKQSISGKEESVFYEYQNGSIKNVASSDDKFYNTSYPTYLVSPNGQKTFWSESRDGKNTIIVGDEDGKNGKTLATLSEYSAYGWFTDKYILLSKNNSELYIASVDQLMESPVKITNFHKPTIRYPGYGYGYGGL